MIRHGLCAECVRCTECEDAIAYCLSEPGPHPCPHDLALCPECLDACADCRRAMEEEMYRSGEYDALADPLVNTHAEKADAAYWAVARNAVEVTPGTFRFPPRESA